MNEPFDGSATAPLGEATALRLPGQSIGTAVRKEYGVTGSYVGSTWVDA